MEKENKVVAQSQKNLLAKVNSSIGITNKLITENNKKLVVEIFEKKPKFFIDLISEYYPPTLEIMSYEKHLDWHSLSLCSDLSILLINLKSQDFDSVKSLDWYYLSQNHNIIWCEKIIDSYIEKWDWSNLCLNSSICWNEEMIDKYESKIDWELLGANCGIPFDEYLIEKYCNQLDFKKLSTNWSVQWNANIIEKHQDKWDWERLSRQLKLPWSGILLEKYKEKLNWKSISFWTETKLTEDIISKYENNWDWTYLSWRFTGWNDNLIRRFKPKIIWNGCNSISRNEIAWSMEMIEKYENDWDWSCFNYNKVKIVYDEWHFHQLEPKINFDRLSIYNSLVWSIEFIEKYKLKWNWNWLSGCDNILWSIELLEKHQSKWNWKILSNNRKIPWSIELITKYQEKWTYHILSNNPKVPLTIQFIHKHSLHLIFTNYNLWKTLEPYVDDEMVINILKKMENGELKS